MQHSAKPLSASKRLTDWLITAKTPADEIYATHDGHTAGELLWGKGESGPIHANNGNGANVTCYGCNAPMDYVKGHKRKRMGLEFDVKPFYRHRGKTTHPSVNRCGAPESLQHKAAKHAVVKYANKLQYHFVCEECKAQVRLKFTTQSECEYKEEVAWVCPRGKSYKLDVGIVSLDGTVLGGVEVYYKHEIGTVKRDALCDGNLAWCEVTAKRVLDAVEHTTWTVQVHSCGFDVCCNCVEKLRTSEFRRLDNELVANVSKQRNTHSARCSILEQARRDWSMLQGTLNEESGGYDSDEVIILPSSTPKRRILSEEDKWKRLRLRVLRALVSESSDYVDDNKEISDEIDDAMDNECRVLIPFGKHKMRSVKEVADLDWKYLLWLAGYDHGHLDEKGRPRIRKDDKYAKWITKDVEQAAKKLTIGCCIKCQVSINQEPWKRLCIDCFCDFKRNGD